jgi:glycosyltransferase involved in cell wall biosynthesis
MNSDISAHGLQPSRGLMVSRKLRVALVAPSLHILGGQAVQADELLRAWRNDPDVEAWLVPINPRLTGWLGKASQVRYVRTILTQLNYWPLLSRELRRADIVHVFSASYFSFLLAPLPAVMVARMLGKPVLVNYRSGQAPDHLGRSPLARFVLSNTSANVVPSKFLVDVFERLGLRAQVVHNIVDTNRFAFRRRNPLRPKLLSSRNLEPLYNVECTLRAFRLVQDRYPDATLTVVGDGIEGKHLRTLSRTLDLRVEFAGRVAHDEIARYFDSADIYLQTPNIDNMPVSVLEAFASGLPVVSTNAGGVPYIVDDGVQGLLAPVGDHAAVARQVLRLLEEPGLPERLTDAALRGCASYSWSTVRDQWMSVYLDAIRNGRGEAARELAA